MRRSLLCFVALFSVIALSSDFRSFAGVITNGGFEDGLTDWSPLGATAVGTAFGNTPSGVGQAQLLTTAAIDIPTIESSLGLAAGRLTELARQGAGVSPSNEPQRGAALFRTITIDATDLSLSFDWNFMTNEVTSLPIIFEQDDFAFWSLTAVAPTAPLGNPDDILARLTPPPALLPGPPGGFTRQTGYLSTTITALQPGEYILGFGVIDVSSGLGTAPVSGLLLDNVQLNAVPEPSALLVLSMVGSGFTMLRRRRR